MCKLMQLILEIADKLFYYIKGDAGGVYEASSGKWSRPQVPPIDPKKDSVVFQQVEVEHYIGKL